MKQSLGDLIPSYRLAGKVDAILDFSQLWVELALNYSQVNHHLQVKVSQSY